MTQKKKWVREVKTVSTFPPEGIFTKDAEMIAETMARADVSPKGIGSAIRMVQYVINRGGKGLTAARKQMACVGPRCWRRSQMEMVKSRIAVARSLPLGPNAIPTMVSACPASDRRGAFQVSPQAPEVETKSRETRVNRGPWSHLRNAFHLWPPELRSGTFPGAVTRLRLSWCL